jgi:hypothetical protein
MKTVKLIVEIEGGTLQAIYGDAMPEGVKLEVVLRDLDNIAQGDLDPAPGAYANAQDFYY